MSAQPRPASLSATRRRFLLAVLAVIVGGHLYCLISGDRDRWPFSRYAMYSSPRSPVEASLYVLVGVEAADVREVELSETWEYLRPLYRGNLHGTFRRLAREPEAKPQLQAAALDCLLRYERYRVEGRHAGPPLAAMRVYQYRWRYADVDRVMRRPTTRELLAEARLDGAEEAK